MYQHFHNDTTDCCECVRLAWPLSPSGRQPWICPGQWFCRSCFGSSWSLRRSFHSRGSIYGGGSVEWGLLLTPYRGRLRTSSFDPPWGSSRTFYSLSQLGTSLHSAVGVTCRSCSGGVLGGEMSWGKTLPKKCHLKRIIKCLHDVRYQSQKSKMEVLMLSMF